MREHVSGMNPRAGTLHHGVFCVYAGRGRTFRPGAGTLRGRPPLQACQRHACAPPTFVYHSGTVALCGQEALRRITVSGFRR